MLLAALEQLDTKQQAAHGQKDREAAADQRGGGREDFGAGYDLHV
jgi:hypothetical protein